MSISIICDAAWFVNCCLYIFPQTYYNDSETKPERMTQMQFKTYPLPGGGGLDVYLRTQAPAMPNALPRPLVLVVPGGA